MKKLVVDNVRFYHATNSSSSHSFIIMPKGYVPQWKNERITDGEKVTGEYGREMFTLDTAAEKQTYIGVALRNALQGLIPEEMIDMMTTHFLGVSVDDGSYIDHQSMLNFPRDYHFPNMLDWDFFTAFREWALQDNVLIFGGNDEDGERNELDDGHSFKLPFTDSYDNLVARHDPVYDSWTLYNRETGLKIRFRFVEERDENTNVEDKYYKDTPDYMLAADKAFFAELVDISITTACPYNCQFCYVSAKPDGIQADYVTICDYLDSLSELRVFECAIGGGGEPTLHPRFVDILEHAKEKGITVSFTTRNMAWLRDTSQWIPIMNAASGFAFSLHDPNEVSKLQALLIANGISLHRVNLHIVMGTVSGGAFQRMLREAHTYGFRVTLLGFKETGFGANYKKQDYDWWMEIIKELGEKRQCPPISIDTALAAESKDLLEANGVSKLLYYTQDGKFSAYIDAVNGKISASSYMVDAPTFDIPDKEWKVSLSEWYIETFAKF